MAAKKEKAKKCLPIGYVPCEEELKKYHAKWDGLESYVAHEAALGNIFRDDVEFRRNVDMRYIIIKCSALNDFYSTNVHKIPEL